MSTINKFLHPLRIKGATGKVYPTEAVQTARAKSVIESEFYKAHLKREQRKREQEEIIAQALRWLNSKGKKLKVA